MQITSSEPDSGKESLAALACLHNGISVEALQAMFAQMFAQTTDWIVALDPQLRLRCVSPMLAMAWNLPAEEIVGKKVTELTKQLFGESSDCEQFITQLQRTLAGESIEHALWPTSPGIQNPPGEQRHIEYSLCPWVGSDGRIAGIIARFCDHTEQHRAEQELVDTRQRLTDFANATSDWFWEMDSDLRFTWLSGQFEKFYNVDKKDLYGKRRSGSPTNAEEQQAWSDHYTALEARQPFRDFIYRVETLSGDRWPKVSGVPIYDKAGKFAGYRGTASDTTSVKLIELQAKQTESRFVRAIDEFPGSFALYDEAARLIVYNRRYAQIHAFLNERLKPGLCYRDCLHAQVGANLFVQQNGDAIKDPVAWVEKQLQRQRLPNDPVELRCADGRWMRLATQHLPDGGYLETMVDITTQKNSEIAIKEERNLLRALIDNIPDFIYAKDTQGRFIVKNHAVSHYMAATRQSAVGLRQTPGDGDTDFDYYARAQAEVYFEEDRRVIQDGDSILNQQEKMSQLEPDNPFWISTTKVALKDTEGKIIGLVGTGRNISEQKTAEARLVESHERFRDFAETAADLFWETDSSLNITYVSERYQELTSYSPEVILGQPYRQVIIPRVSSHSEFNRVTRCLDNCTPFGDLEITVQQKGRDARHIVLSGKPCFDGDNRFVGYRGAGRDITKARNLEKMLSYQASHDELTQLPNRREFLRRLELAAKTVRTTNQPSVLGYLDLDQFKIVNDSVGHRAGDELLVQVTALIAGQLRKTDTIARLGGDEFGILIPNTSVEKALSTAQLIIKQFEAFRFAWNGQVFGVGTSIGLVEIGDTNADATELMSRADTACFAAKDAGRGRVQIYSPDVIDLPLQHKQLLMAAGIRDSIATNRFRLFAQPIAALSDGNSNAMTIEHYEILLRLTGKDDTLIYPGTIIPAAERYGLMGDIDRWVVSNTLQQMHNCNSKTAPLSVTINLSGQSLSDPTLADFVTDQLKHHQIDPGHICFEITETAAIRNLAQAQKFIAIMKGVGCKFALDDFGSGLSSFSYLKHFAVDYLKIDGSFIRDIVDDPTDRIMVTSINQIGKSLGIKTIAEFVENDAIIEELRTIGVDLLQGYGIGKPVEFASCFEAS